MSIKLPFVPPGPYRYVADWLGGSKQTTPLPYGNFSGLPAGLEQVDETYADDVPEPYAGTPVQYEQPIGFADPGLLQAQQWLSENQGSTPPADSGVNDTKNMNDGAGETAPAASLGSELTPPKAPKPFNIKDYQIQLDDLDDKIDSIKRRP